MRSFRLFGISIDAVRDIFGADDELAARLRESAAPLLPQANKRDSSLLGKLGPLFKRDRATEVDARQPLASDADALLAGGYIQHDRAPQCWQILLAWLEDLSATQCSFHVEDLDPVEFDLARIGLSSEFSLRRLAERDLSIPLRALPGQISGYARHQQAADMAAALEQVMADPLDDAPLREDSQRVVDELVPFLGRVNSGDDALDVVTVTTEMLATPSA